MLEQEQEKFDQASTEIYDYYSMAYGGNGLGVFMEAIEEYPELPLKDIYDLIAPKEEEDEIPDEILETEDDIRRWNKTCNELAKVELEEEGTYD